MDRHFGSMLWLVILAISQCASFAVLEFKVNALDETAKSALMDSVKQSEHKDLLRRVENLERELVPRSEHLLRDAELNKRLDQIQESIREVQDRLDKRSIKP